MHDIINFYKRNHCFLCTRNKALGFNPKCTEKEKSHGNIIIIESKLLTGQLNNSIESLFLHNFIYKKQKFQEMFLTFFAKSSVVKLIFNKYQK